jgi:cell division protein FtsN
MGNAKARTPPIALPKHLSALTPSAPPPQESDNADRRPFAFAAPGIPLPVPADSPDDTIRQAKERLASMVRRGLMTAIFESEKNARTASEAYFVQIGSFRMRAEADTQVDAAKGRFADLVVGLGMRVRKVELAPQVSFYRVQIGPIETQSVAVKLCRTLQNLKQDCLATAETESGQRLATPRRIEGGWASIGQDGLYADGSATRHLDARAQPSCARK